MATRGPDRRAGRGWSARRVQRMAPVRPWRWSQPAGPRRDGPLGWCAGQSRRTAPGRPGRRTQSAGPGGTGPGRLTAGDWRARRCRIARPGRAVIRGWSSGPGETGVRGRALMGQVRMGRQRKGQRGWSSGWAATARPGAPPAAGHRRAPCRPCGRLPAHRALWWTGTRRTTSRWRASGRGGGGPNRRGERPRARRPAGPRLRRSWAAARTHRGWARRRPGGGAEPARRDGLRAGPCGRRARCRGRAGAADRAQRAPAAARAAGHRAQPGQRHRHPMPGGRPHPANGHAPAGHSAQAEPADPDPRSPATPTPRATGQTRTHAYSAAHHGGKGQPNGKMPGGVPPAL